MGTTNTRRSKPGENRPQALPVTHDMREAIIEARQLIQRRPLRDDVTYPSGDP